MAETIRQLLDESKLSATQVLVLAVCFFLNMLDGMDVLAISFAAPAISDAWSISPESLGVVFSAALVGMTVGAVFLSPYSDVIGRRKVVLASLVMIALGMLATSRATSITELVVLRFAAGLGIGSMLASMTSLVSEYAPDRLRNVFVLILHAGYPIGAMLAGFVAAEILPAYGWQSLFVFAGCATLLALPVVFFLLPESLEFLSKRQPKDSLAKINRVLTKMGHVRLSELPEKTGSDSSRTTSVRTLFNDHLRVRTVRLWLSFFMSFATLYFLLSWVVKLAIDSGLPLTSAIYAGVCLNLGAFFGSLGLGALSNRFGLMRVIATFFVFGGLFIVVYGSADVGVLWKLILVFILMFFVQGAFTGLYAVAARLYDTEIRTTGVGWAIGAGRLGAIFGPITAGVILGAGITISWTFAVFALPMLLAAFIVLQIRLAE
ncbi:MAG: MFS transporter [Pseudomonadota bacterium]